MKLSAHGTLGNWVSSSNATFRELGFAIPKFALSPSPVSQFRVIYSFS